MLAQGLLDSTGPAQFTSALARALGFEGIDGLEEKADSLADAIQRGDGLTVLDWTRALAVLEVVFVSEVFNGDWGSVHGRSDQHWLGVLRSLQAKVPFDRELLPE